MTTTTPGSTPATGQIDPDAPVYVISVAADLVGVHPQTLRAYERAGLVRPSRTRGGSRRYSANDIHRMRRIQALTDEGIPFAGVARILELERRLAQLSRPSTALVPRTRPPTPHPGRGRVRPRRAGSAASTPERPRRT